MDLYFIVGELTFPGGVAEQWRAADLPPTAKRRQPTTLDAVLASAEGPVRLEVRDDTVSLRVYLIDSAYFMVKDELAASLEVARKLGWLGLILCSVGCSDSGSTPCCPTPPSVRPCTR